MAAGRNHAGGRGVLTRAGDRLVFNYDAAISPAQMHPDLRTGAAAQGGRPAAVGGLSMPNSSAMRT